MEKNSQIENENDITIEQSKQENDDSYVTPKYKILHRGFFDMTDFTGGRYSSYDLYFINIFLLS